MCITLYSLFSYQSNSIQRHTCLIHFGVIAKREYRKRKLIFEINVNFLFHSIKVSNGNSSMNLVLSYIIVWCPGSRSLENIISRDILLHQNSLSLLQLTSYVDIDWQKMIYESNCTMFVNVTPETTDLLFCEYEWMSKQRKHATFIFS